MAYVTIQIEAMAREKLRAAQNVAAGLAPHSPRPTMSATLIAALAVATARPDEFAAAIEIAREES